MQDDELRANCKMWKDECLELREQLASAREMIISYNELCLGSAKAIQWLKENE